MRLSFFKNTFLLWVFICFSCGSQTKEKNELSREEIVINDFVSTENIMENKILTGAEQAEAYLPFLKNKNVGVVANQTSILFNEGNKHLVDFLIENNIAVRTVFAPEHGFRGTADAGEHIKDGVDIETGVPIVSLYGDNKKPKLEQIKETKKYESDINKGISQINMMVFDLQDVGARFYTYISTLHYVMEACAEANIPIIILDRPNPNGHYIDGPVLEPEHSSFVGMHPIPVVYGMTIGEYAQMINGEGWLKNKVKCDLNVIKLKNYNHLTEYSLPIKPSPNLPNDKAINLYPSLCFFEGTVVSAGRGTDMQFQIFGAPYLSSEKYPYSFTPKSNEGAKFPKFKGETCNGMDLRNVERLGKINLNWLIDAYNNSGKNPEFFNNFFTNLAGTKKLQQQIEAGLSEKEIRESWQDGLKKFDVTRKKYLLYK